MDIIVMAETNYPVVFRREFAIQETYIYNVRARV